MKSNGPKIDPFGTPCSFKPWCNEHIHAIKYNKDASTYAQHILTTGYSYGDLKIQKQNKQMNEVLFDLNNSIFEAIYNHYTNQ
jgi:hypothetical protein